LGVLAKRNTTTTNTINALFLVKTRLKK